MAGKAPWESAQQVQDIGATEEPLRCFACRRLWPRAVMRWGARSAGPIWFPRTVRVLRCPDCLPS